MIAATLPKLTDKQRKFADCYLMTGDAKEALKAGGYNAKNVDVAASRCKNNPTIKAYLEHRSKELVLDNLDDIAALVKGLNSKDKYCLELYRAYEAIKEAKNATKFKYFELLGKVLGHINERNVSNLNFSVDNRSLTHVEVVQSASGIMNKLQRLIGKRSEHPQDVVIHPVKSDNPTSNKTLDNATAQ